MKLWMKPYLESPPQPCFSRMSLRIASRSAGLSLPSPSVSYFFRRSERRAARSAFIAALVVALLGPGDRDARRRRGDHQGRDHLLHVSSWGGRSRGRTRWDWTRPAVAG